MQQMKAAVADPAAIVRQWRGETGGQAIGCAPLYGPQEMITAAGMLPVGIWGGQIEISEASAYLANFACSVTRAIMELQLKGAYHVLNGIIFPSTCDHMQCLSDVWKSAFPGQWQWDLVYPKNRQTAGAGPYLRKTLEKLKVRLEELAGKEITDKALQKSIAIYNESRQLMKRLYAVRLKHPGLLAPRDMAAVVKASLFLPRAEHNRLVVRLLKKLKNKTPLPFQGHRLVLTGIMAEPEMLLDYITECKGTVVDDDLALGSRLFKNEIKLTGDPLTNLTDYFLGLGPCATLYSPAQNRGQYLIDLVRTSRADGVITIMMKFCEPEEFDYALIHQQLDAAGVSYLSLEVEQQMRFPEQLRTPIEAFLEHLR